MLAGGGADGDLSPLGTAGGAIFQADGVGQGQVGILIVDFPADADLAAARRQRPQRDRGRHRVDHDLDVRLGPLQRGRERPIVHVDRLHREPVETVPLDGDREFALLRQRGGLQLPGAALIGRHVQPQAAQLLRERAKWDVEALCREKVMVIGFSWASATPSSQQNVTNTSSRDVFRIVVSLTGHPRE